MELFGEPIEILDDLNLF